MRLNSVGVVDIRDAIKNHWEYLKIGKGTVSAFPTAFNTWGVGFYFTKAKSSAATSADSFTRVFNILTMEGLSQTINAIADTTTSSGNTIQSLENISDIDKTHLEEYRISIETEIIR